MKTRFCPPLVAALLLSPSVFADARLVDTIDKNHCTKLAEQTCSSQKAKEENAVAKCQQWHLDKASEVGANRVLISDTLATEHRRPHFDGSIKTIVERVFNAEYYQCADTAPATAPQTGQPARTIAERLRVLESLREQQLITDQEYQQKRQAILDEL